MTIRCSGISTQFIQCEAGVGHILYITLWNKTMKHFGTHVAESRLIYLLFTYFLTYCLFPET